MSAAHVPCGQVSYVGGKPIACDWHRPNGERLCPDCNPRPVSEGTASAQRINRTAPVQRQACDFASSGCDYPAGQCIGLCGGGRP